MADEFKPITEAEAKQALASLKRQIEIFANRASMPADKRNRILTSFDTIPKATTSDLAAIKRLELEWKDRDAKLTSYLGSHSYSYSEVDTARKALDDELAKPGSDFARIASGELSSTEMGKIHLRLLNDTISRGTFLDKHAQISEYDLKTLKVRQDAAALLVSRDAMSAQEPKVAQAAQVTPTIQIQQPTPVPQFPLKPEIVKVPVGKQMQLLPINQAQQPVAMSPPKLPLVLKKNPEQQVEPVIKQPLPKVSIETPVSAPLERSVRKTLVMPANNDQSAVVLAVGGTTSPGSERGGLLTRLMEMLENLFKGSALSTKEAPQQTTVLANQNLYKPITSDIRNAASSSLTAKDRPTGYDTAGHGGAIPNNNASELKI